jgi:hypothetical protein
VIESTPADLEWRIWLARRQPAQAVAVVVALFATAGWAFILFHHLLPVLVAAFLLLGAVAEFLFPIRYRLTPQGAEARNLFCWRRITWAEVKRVSILGTEVRLSPLARPGGREPFRGVVLRCEANPEAILAAVRHFAPHVRTKADVAASRD